MPRSDWAFAWAAILALAAVLAAAWTAARARAAQSARQKQAGCRRALRQFSQWLSQPRRRDELVEHAARVVEQTLQPPSWGLMLRRGETLIVERCAGLNLEAGAPCPDSLRGALAAWLATQRRSLCLVTETAWLFSLDAAERQAIEKIQASLYIPLFNDQCLNGILALGSATPRCPYSPDELDFLTALADQINIAFEVSQLIGELEQRVSQLAVLNETGQALSSSLRIQDLLEKIYGQIGRLMDARNLYVALYDPESDTVSFPLALENNQRKQWRERQAGHGLTEYIIRQRCPLLFERDVEQHAAQLGIQMIGTPARSWLGVPMLANKQAIGVIAVQHFEREGAYTRDDLNILSTLASQAAIAIVNARLYEQADQTLAKRVRDLSKLYQASLALAFSTETQDVLNQVGELTREVTASDSVSIYLYDQRADSFKLAAAVGEPLPGDHGAQARPRGMTRRALAERRSFIVPDTELEADLNPTVRQAGIRALVCLPLISKGQALGVMYVNSRQPLKYTDDDVQLASALASQAAIAIESGELFKHLADGRDRLQAVLDSTREGIMMLDNHGYIVFANAMFGELFDTSPAALTGRRLLDVVAERSAPPEPTLAVMMDVIYETLGELAERTDAVHTSQVAVAHPPRFFERVSSPVRDAAGASMGRLLTLRDITEEKKAEVLREDLTRMMVHDLRSPLSGILGSLQVLEGSLVDEYHKQAVRIALNSSNRLLNLINALLDISKMEEGRMPLNRQPLRWPKLINTAIERVTLLAANENIQMQPELEANLPPVLADESILLRVLNNLLDNALKFSPAGSTVKVSVTSTQSNVPETLCQISDAGPGIPPEHQERIFEKFFQVPDNAGRRKGSGLGLAFCRLAIEAHGGRIWVTSSPGQGSTFAFTLPANAS